MIDTDDPQPQLMPTGSVRLDMGRSQPIRSAGPVAPPQPVGQPTPGGAKLDMSRSQPITAPTTAQPEEPSLLDRMKANWQSNMTPQDTGHPFTDFVHNAGGRAAHSFVQPLVHPVDTALGLARLMSQSPYDTEREIAETYLKSKHPAADVTGDLAAMALQGGVAGAGAELLPEAGSALVEAGGKGVDTARNTAARTRAVFSHDMAQRDLQTAIRNGVDNAAQDSGLKVRSTDANGAPVSIRSIARNASDELHEKALDVSRRIDLARDEAVSLRPKGTDRLENYTQQIGDLQKQLRSNPADSKTIKLLDELHDARNDALNETANRGMGLNPQRIGRAQRLFDQQAGMEQLGHHFASSTEGIAPEMVRPGMKVKPETVVAAKLAPKLEAMESTGLLKKALGSEHAEDLLNEVSAAEMRAAKIDRATKLATKAGMGAAGIGGAWKLFDLIKELVQ